MSEREKRNGYPLGVLGCYADIVGIVDSLNENKVRRNFRDGEYFNFAAGDRFLIRLSTPSSPVAIRYKSPAENLPLFQCYFYRHNFDNLTRIVVERTTIEA